jgi:hypothetical protein
MSGLYIDSIMCKCTEVYTPEHLYCFTGPCAVTGKNVTVKIPAAALFELRQGVHIQDALHMMTAEEREFVLSGTSAEGWDKLFPPEEKKP